MKETIKNQYAHTFRVFEKVVADFSEEDWLSLGYDANVPARLSLHILQSAQYYLKDQEKIAFSSGKKFDIHSSEAALNEFPTQEDIISGIICYADKVESWINEMNFYDQNPDFPWAGKTQFGVSIFLLRHTLFHLGELSGLLNQSKKGDVKDHYVGEIK